MTTLLPPLLQRPQAKAPDRAGLRQFEVSKYEAQPSRSRLALVDAKEMAAILGISRDALYDVVRDGQVPAGCYRLGERWRFNPEEVLDSLRDDRVLQGPHGMAI